MRSSMAFACDSLSNLVGWKILCHVSPCHVSPCATANYAWLLGTVCSCLPSCWFNGLWYASTTRSEDATSCCQSTYIHMTTHVVIVNRTHSSYFQFRASRTMYRQTLTLNPPNPKSELLEILCNQQPSYLLGPGLSYEKMTRRKVKSPSTSWDTPTTTGLSI